SYHVIHEDVLSVGRLMMPCLLRAVIALGFQAAVVKLLRKIALGIAATKRGGTHARVAFTAVLVAAPIFDADARLRPYGLGGTGAEEQGARQGQGGDEFPHDEVLSVEGV